MQIYFKMFFGSIVGYISSIDDNGIYLVACMGNADYLVEVCRIAVGRHEMGLIGLFYLQRIRNFCAQRVFEKEIQGIFLLGIAHGHADTVYLNIFIDKHGVDTRNLSSGNSKRVFQRCSYP